MVSDSLFKKLNEKHFKCLNPCSNGIWSLTNKAGSPAAPALVLILVLMEYGL